MTEITLHNHNIHQGFTLQGPDAALSSRWPLSTVALALERDLRQACKELPLPQPKICVTALTQQQEGHLHITVSTDIPDRFAPYIEQFNTAVWRYNFQTFAPRRGVLCPTDQRYSFELSISKPDSSE